MIKSLFAKLSLVLLLVFISLSILTVSITYFSSHLYQQEVMQKLNARIAEHIVKETELLKDDRVNHPALRQLFKSLMVLNPNIEIYLLDHEGGILAFSAPTWKVVRMSVDTAPIKRYLGQQSLLPVRGDDPRNYDRSKVFSAYPVPFNNKPDGYVYVILGGEIYESVVQTIQSSHILSLSLLIIVAGLVVLFLLSIFMFKKITRRIQQLVGKINDFERSPATMPVFEHPKINGDEINQLNQAFASMAFKTHQQIDELQTNDDLRRKLVANVSHDLRTPLATLQGYIETLLMKDDQLEPELRKQYLNTTIKHCHRLNKLVSELFELARLDAQETRVHIEAFNLAELIEDIIAKYDLRARQKSISLQADYFATDVFVMADVAMIERVLENLLDNAFRHVPPGGNIKITTNEVNEQIEIYVKDTGCGIPESELPLIFDRFYQLDQSRNTENQHSGLGLAIVKKIMELHNSIIQVSSIPQKETVFSFSLPVYHQ